MNEVTVGSWNAWNAFGDQERLKPAVEIVKQLDADILYIPETVSREEEGNETSERFIEIIEEQLGYEGQFSSYSPLPDVRNEHLMSIWSRVPTERTRLLLGNRYGFRSDLSDADLSVYAIHFPDNNEEKRVESAAAVADNWRHAGLLNAVVMGDFNAMHRQDRKALMARFAGKLFSGFEVEDYYDRSKKLQRMAGKIIRLGQMAEGKTLNVLEQAGLQDVDVERRSTIGQGPVSFQLDHIMVSKGLRAARFTLLPPLTPDNVRLSDHSAISAAISIKIQS